MSITLDVKAPARLSQAGVLLAPITAGIYYFAIKIAFAQSIIPVLGRSDLFDVPHWGGHWIYRVVAEVISVGFDTFVATGLAPRRERIAAIVGGCGIALGFVIKLAITFNIWEGGEPGTIISVEPWYQRAIDGAMVICAPLIGSFVAEPAEEMHRDTPGGFGGINRLHFLWLWLAAYGYAVGLITPIGKYFAFEDANVLTTYLLVAINGIPAAAIGVPAYYGLAFLVGYHGNTMHPAGRNLVGVLVLVFGLLVGLVIEESWYFLMRTIAEFFFGSE